MRLAYFSPLPPLRSGIADYSQELLPNLARYAEIELFIDDGYQPVPAISERFRVYNYQRFPSVTRKQPYDAVLYHIGNHAKYHGTIYHTLLEYPGIVVLHEYVLHHLIQGITLARGNPRAYLQEMRYCYGRTGAYLARLMIDTGWEVNAWTYPLFERVVDASLGVIVHNEYTRQRVLASRPLARIAKVNSPFCPDAVPNSCGDTSALRRALGLPEDAFVIASFGFITPQKRLESCLRAFARLRQALPQTVYFLVGEVSPYYNLQPLLDSELRDGVILTGRVSLESFLQYMAAADLAVNLRYPTAGETSATLIRLMGLGKPVIVSNVGAFAEYPDDCCAKVDVDETEEEMLLAMMHALAGNEDLRRQMGANARRYVQTHHTPEEAAQSYVEFIRGIAASPPTPPAAMTPMDWPSEDDVLAGVIADVAAEMVNLQIGEDRDFMQEIASVIVDLNMDQ
jgi:glycosyltransferase involved in cell wall biosynthesis